MTPETARLLFATFAPDLQRALKVAATRNAWCPATWPLQIELIQDALLRGADEPDLAALYAAAPTQEPI